VESGKKGKRRERIMVWHISIIYNKSSPNNKHVACHGGDRHIEDV